MVSKYVPSNRRMLILWATNRWPKEDISKFKNMSKRQLYWLWYNKSKYR